MNNICGKCNFNLKALSSNRVCCEQGTINGFNVKAVPLDCLDFKPIESEPDYDGLAQRRREDNMWQTEERIKR